MLGRSVRSEYSDALSGHGFNRAENAAKSIRLQPLRFCFFAFEAELPNSHPDSEAHR